jgi:hypothetical protein
MKHAGIRPYFSLAALVAASLLFVRAVDTCGPTPPPKPDEAARVQLGNFQVKDDKAKAWATLSLADAFDQLATGNFQDPAISSWQVTTDSAGQAQICPDSSINAGPQTCDDVACRIYVFTNTVFGAYPCPESALGTAGCSLIGSQALANCHMTINTISASATGLGTWYSLTYLWDSQMTLVVAGEGTIEVTPIVELSFAGEVPPLAQMEPVERALASRRIEVSSRVPGQPVTVEVENGRAQFLYTAPDAKLEELGLDPLLPGRVWHSVEQLPILVEQLAVIEPQLVPWLEQIWEGAKVDDIDLGPQDQISPGAQLAVITLGELWQDPRLQESILYGVDWLRLTEEVLGEPTRVQIARLEPTGSLTKTGPDAREAGYDPERARALVEEARREIPIMPLLVPAGDDALLKAADLVTQQLAEIGISMGIEPVARDEIQARMAAMGPTGPPAIALSRR